MNPRYTLSFIFIAIGAILFILPATAHDARPLFVQMNESDAGMVRLTWRAPSSVDIGQAPMLTLGEPCTAMHERKELRSLRGAALYQCSNGLAEVHLNISYPLYNPSLSTMVRVEFASGEIRSAILDPAVSNWTVPARETFSGVAKNYFTVGVVHILGGVDHLLFLAGLLYIARTPRRVLVTITGFTIAHSLTIFLVALNLIRVSVPAVETIIALSIVFLATEIARNNRETLTWRRPVYVAAGFGLVHGAGFAAALAEIGLPQTEKISALLFFNLGVEAGQIGIILAVFTVGWITMRLTKLQLSKIDDVPLRPVFSYGLGIVSALWFIERFARAIA